MTTEAQNTPVSTPSGPSAGLEGQDATQEETQDAADRDRALAAADAAYADAWAAEHGARAALDRAEADRGRPITCAHCGHEHAGKGLAGICIGCPCPGFLAADAEKDATQETPDATEAAQRRVERYEDLAVRLLELNDFRAHDRAVASRIGSAYRSVADQEQAEKDATIAELRAEVERHRALHESVRAQADAALKARVAELEAIVAKAWDEGFDVATDNFVHSDYCGRTCQCQGIHGQSNPYLDAPKDTTAP